MTNESEKKPNPLLPHAPHQISSVPKKSSEPQKIQILPATEKKQILPVMPKTPFLKPEVLPSVSTEVKPSLSTPQIKKDIKPVDPKPAEIKTPIIPKTNSVLSPKPEVTITQIYPSSPTVITPSLITSPNPLVEVSHKLTQIETKLDNISEILQKTDKKAI